MGFPGAVAVDDENQSWREWIGKLVDGESVVVGEFWQEYGPRLQRLAEKRISSRLQRRVGPEDVIQSVCRTFFRRAAEGEFHFADSDDLWRLLCAITLTKIRDKARYHNRQKRGVDQERHLESGSKEHAGWAENLADDGPLPEEAAELAEYLEQLLSGMDDEEKQIVEMKIQQYTNLEIARSIGCSERTVRRLLARVKARLRRSLDETFAGEMST